jgi:hypothetical protein
MLGTVDARRAGHEDRLELAGVQVSPPSLFRVIVAGQFHLTLRATELRSTGVLDEHLDHLRLMI